MCVEYKWDPPEEWGVSSTFFACTSLSCLLRAHCSYFLSIVALVLVAGEKNLVFFTMKRYCARVHRHSWPSSHVLDHIDCFQSFQKHAYFKNSYTGLYFVMLCVSCQFGGDNQLRRSQLSMTLTWWCYTWAAKGTAFYECMLRFGSCCTLLSVTVDGNKIYIHVSFT